MTVKERLIVLTYTKIKDSAIVIHTISRSEGRRSFLVHLGKHSSLAMFQPLSILVHCSGALPLSSFPALGF